MACICNCTQEEMEKMNKKKLLERLKTFSYHQLLSMMPTDFLESEGLMELRENNARKNNLMYNMLPKNKRCTSTKVDTKQNSCHCHNTKSIEKKKDSRNTLRKKHDDNNAFKRKNSDSYAIRTKSDDNKEVKRVCHGKNSFGSNYYKSSDVKRKVNDSNDAEKADDDRNLIIKYFQNNTEMKNKSNDNNVVMRKTDDRSHHDKNSIKKFFHTSAVVKNTNNDSNAVKKKIDDSNVESVYHDNVLVKSIPHDKTCVKNVTRIYVKNVDKHKSDNGNTMKKTIDDRDSAKQIHYDTKSIESFFHNSIPVKNSSTINRVDNQNNLGQKIYYANNLKRKSDGNLSKKKADDSTTANKVSMIQIDLKDNNSILILQ